MPPTTPESTLFLFHHGMWGKDSLPSFLHTTIRARAVWAPWVTFLGLSGVAFVFTLLTQHLRYKIAQKMD
jgi:hypothetical protein